MPLYCDIQIGISKASNEVEIFRNLLEAIKKIGFVSEMHGPKNYQVEFDDPFIEPLTTRCELCDLFILVIKDDNARFTFLQCKRDFSKKYIPNGTTSIPLRQNYLLKNKPEIYPHVKKFNIPRTLLSKSLLPSIGTLGVFYLESSGNINMDFSIMGLNHTSSIIGVADFQKNANKVYTCHGVKNQVRKLNGYDEVECLDNLNDFESYLLDLKIGEPVSSNNRLNSIFALTIAKDALLKEPLTNSNTISKIELLFERLDYRTIDNFDSKATLAHMINVAVIDVK